jgi:hypothetical protein
MILPELDKMLMVDTISLCNYYVAMGYGDNSEYHEKIWRPYFCDHYSHGDSYITWSHIESPENPFDELINEFLVAYPELNGKVNFVS